MRSRGGGEVRGQHGRRVPDIAISSAAAVRAFGIEPRVAMISFSTGTSGKGSDVDKAAEATRVVREREPELAVDGPLQYDAAAVASVGKAPRIAIAAASSIRKGSIRAVLRLACHLCRSSAGIKVIWLASAY